MWHTYYSQTMDLLSFIFQHLAVSNIDPGQDFQTQDHYGRVKGQIKVIPLCCAPTTPKQCLYQVSRLLRQGHTIKVHTYTLTNVPTKIQLPTHYSF